MDAHPMINIQDEEKKICWWCGQNSIKTLVVISFQRMKYGHKSTHGIFHRKHLSSTQIDKIAIKMQQVAHSDVFGRLWPLPLGAE